jgi:sugar/nucleoside kinase (ribokinase family)
MEDKTITVSIFGSLNVDRFLRMDRLPQEGETISAEGFLLAFGGKVSIG